MTLCQAVMLGTIDLLGAVGYGCWHGSWGAGLWMGIVLLKLTQWSVAVAGHYGEQGRKEAYGQHEHHAVR
jgi:hypothetical protein